MSPIAAAATAALLIIGSAAAGVVLRSRLPEAHLTGDSKDVIKLATALIATLSALVLGLLFAATHDSFDATSAAVSRMTADVAELDQLMVEYGPEADPVRAALRLEVQWLLASLWRTEGPGGTAGARPLRHQEGMIAKVRDLDPHGPVQTSLKARAHQVATDLAQVRLDLFAQPSDSLSSTFMVTLVAWLMVIFCVFGMSAPPNATLLTVLALCILSAAAALYLIIELGQPFDGLMQVSSEGLRHALQ
ncbi:MAG: hypothetical protein U1E23_02335 [Reyranellaceae bacterium]